MTGPTIAEARKAATEKRKKREAEEAAAAAAGKTKASPREKSFLDKIRKDRVDTALDAIEQGVNEADEDTGKKKK